MEDNIKSDITKEMNNKKQELKYLFTLFYVLKGVSNGIFNFKRNTQKICEFLYIKNVDLSEEKKQEYRETKYYNTSVNTKNNKDLFDKCEYDFFNILIDLYNENHNKLNKQQTLAKLSVNYNKFFKAVQEKLNQTDYVEKYSFNAKSFVMRRYACLFALTVLSEEIINCDIANRIRKNAENETERVLNSHLIREYNIEARKFFGQMEKQEDMQMIAYNNMLLQSNGLYVSEGVEYFIEGIYKDMVREYKNIREITK